MANKYQQLMTYRWLGKTKPSIGSYYQAKFYFLAKASYGRSKTSERSTRRKIRPRAHYSSLAARYQEPSGTVCKMVHPRRLDRNWLTGRFLDNGSFHRTVFWLVASLLSKLKINYPSQSEGQQAIRQRAAGKVALAAACWFR